MTSIIPRVRDLIRALQALDPDLPVLVDGYEGGYEILSLERARVQYRPSVGWTGDFKDFDDAFGGPEPVDVIVLTRFIDDDAETIVLEGITDASGQLLRGAP